MDTTGRTTDPERLLRILDCLKQEFALAMKEGGIGAFSRMYDNGRKHILNEGEYCISFKQWKEICLKAKFKKITIQSVPNFEWFKAGFVFGDKAVTEVEQSDLPEEIKVTLKNTKKYAEGPGFSMDVKSPELIEIKIQN